MKESISKFITEGKALLWIKTNDFQEVERAMIESLNSLENKKFYIYEKGKTINFLNDSIESGMDDLFNTLDELYPQGIRKIPVFLLIKGGIDEILKKNNLDYFREIVDTKKEAPRYNFTVIIADNEDVPPQLENMTDFIDKQITDNEGAIKKYILDLAKFEKLELDENNIEKTSFVDEEKEVFDIEVCKYPTTQKMWMEVMENNPSRFEGDNRPVENITWWEALEYCNKLSEKYGLEPVYDLSKSEQGILMIKELGGETVYPDVANFKNTEGFRLPTEVEWEWFARGGQNAIEQGTFDYTYSGSNNINEVAWYYENSGQKNKKGSTQEVGLKKPNQLGLYDCSGNIGEWCYDTAESYDTTESIENGKNYIYKAFDSSNIYRRLKGGSWFDDAKSCVIPNRYSSQAIQAEFCVTFDIRNNQGINTFSLIGFRLVRTV